MHPGLQECGKVVRVGGMEASRCPRGKGTCKTLLHLRLNIGGGMGRSREPPWETTSVMMLRLHEGGEKWVDSAHV